MSSNTPSPFTFTANTNTPTTPLTPSTTTSSETTLTPRKSAKTKKLPSSSSTSTGSHPQKRRCVSNACIACRRRKSKCDGQLPSCAACSSVYGTECVYDPNSDHRRKGVYKKDIEGLQNRNSTLQTLVEAILNLPFEKAWTLVLEMRSCDNLEELADGVEKEGMNWRNGGEGSAGENGGDGGIDGTGRESERIGTDGRGYSVESDGRQEEEDNDFEAELAGKMGQLRVDGEGQVKFVGATSNLALLPKHERPPEQTHIYGLDSALNRDYNTVRLYPPDDITDSTGLSDDGFDAITSWTTVTPDRGLIEHLLNMYFTWHYPYFTTLSRELFEADFKRGNRNSLRKSPSPGASPGSISSITTGTQKIPKYCSPLLVNAMLALGCHFTNRDGSREFSNDPDTAGDHFFKEAKRLILEENELETARLTTVQALGLMSVREAGCGREGRGWVYSGMCFRMALDMGLHRDVSQAEKGVLGDKDVDARRVTFWGCFLFDKCWSNYLGRMPQIPREIVTVPRYEVLPAEDAKSWSPYTDTGNGFGNSQPARTRAVGLQISELCEISGDILMAFYCQNPTLAVPTSHKETKKEAKDLIKLQEIWLRLEKWKKDLPVELLPRDGSLPPVLLMHMFHQLLYIHLFRPFLKQNTTWETLPLAHLAPRSQCITAAFTISKLLRFYKSGYGLRQICNVAAYIILSACSIHLINIENKNSRRDIIQAVKALENMGDGWLCAKRALLIVKSIVKRWRIDIPEEAMAVLRRTGNWGRFSDLPEGSMDDHQAYGFANKVATSAVNAGTIATMGDSTGNPDGQSRQDARHHEAMDWGFGGDWGGAAGIPVLGSQADDGYAGYSIASPSTMQEPSQAQRPHLAQQRQQTQSQQSFAPYSPGTRAPIFSNIAHMPIPSAPVPHPQQQSHQTQYHTAYAAPYIPYPQAHHQQRHPPTSIATTLSTPTQSVPYITTSQDSYPYMQISEPPPSAPQPFQWAMKDAFGLMEGLTGSTGGPGPIGRGNPGAGGGLGQSGQGR
ncbi:hypothetical protein BJ508DRAFT_414997 [Ascobolus immersus RN42]|uniref:Zn(2)-C6 fungal-type domain-containing protein n=1 Tax=Ascobolus immersus RN42 TaxID=1160509 RepID=A0A3N4I527_ASCIM|nr:hypothetical protein BJ508DRAFT_414997 [Ascobolus immersus RN42]